jgi:hypothetical protein
MEIFVDEPCESLDVQEVNVPGTPEVNRGGAGK